MREKQGENRDLHRGLEQRHGLGPTAPKKAGSRTQHQPRPVPDWEGEQRVTNWAKIRS